MERMNQFFFVKLSIASTNDGDRKKNMKMFSGEKVHDDIETIGLRARECIVKRKRNLNREMW